MVPASRARIRLSAAIVPYPWPRYVTSVVRRNSSASTSQNGARIAAIASLTQTSMSPSSAVARSAAPSPCAPSAGPRGRARGPDGGRDRERAAAKLADLARGDLERFLVAREERDRVAAAGGARGGGGAGGGG